MSNQGLDIRIIGARDAGKTTYLVALAGLKDGYRGKLPNLTIYPKNQDSESLYDDHLNILRQGLKVGSTYKRDAVQIPYYSFDIDIPSAKKLSGVKFELIARDFAGEVFEDLAHKHKWGDIQDFIDDLFTVTGWMIMMTDYDHSQDQKYRDALTNLWEFLRMRQDNNIELKQLRIAMVMSKCERGEIWPGRLDPEEDLFRVRLPKTYKFLRNKSPEKENRVKFFACSAFGVMDERTDDFDPRPNRYLPDEEGDSDRSAFIRNSDKWQPYGLISPLYWLTTGRLLHDQRF